MRGWQPVDFFVTAGLSSHCNNTECSPECRILPSLPTRQVPQPRPEAPHPHPVWPAYLQMKSCLTFSLTHWGRDIVAIILQIHVFIFNVFWLQFDWIVFPMVKYIYIYVCLHVYIYLKFHWRKYDPSQYNIIQAPCIHIYILLTYNTKLC